MNKTRIAAIEKEIQRVVSDLLLIEIKNPKLKLNDGMVSIVKTSLTGDARECKIYISAYTNNSSLNKVKFQKGLDEIKRFVRKRVSEELKLRYTPEIYLILDDSIEQGIRINQKINEINKV